MRRYLIALCSIFSRGGLSNRGLSSKGDTNQILRYKEHQYDYSSDSLGAKA